MTEYIYGVALNGASPVSTYKVIHETPQTYTIDRPTGKYVRKATMSDRWEFYFVKEESAKSFYESLLRAIEKRSKHIDLHYVHKILTVIRDEEFCTDKLDDVIAYIEEYL